MSVFLDEALALAADGYAVFPMSPRTKIPFAGSRGFLDATTDERRIREWWEWCPDANVGIWCRASGVVVIDVDWRVEGARERWEQLCAAHPLCPTYVVASGDDQGGRHYYFAADQQDCYRASLGRGIDIKWNGYAVVPPSIHPKSGQPYVVAPESSECVAPLPDWLRAMLLKPEPTPGTDTELPPATAEELKAAEEDLMTFPGGAFAAACILHQGWGFSDVEALPILKRWSAKVWQRDDDAYLLRRLASARGYASGGRGEKREAWQLGQLFAIVPAALAPPPVEQRDDEQRDDGGRFLAELDRAGKDIATWRAGGASGPPRCLFGPGRAIDRKDWEKPDWLIRGLLLADGVPVVAGEPKSDKTWCALEMAMAVATGTKAFREFEVPKARPAALLLAEDSERSLRNRMRALASARGMSLGDAMDSISFVCRARVNLLDDADLALVIASLRSLPAPPGLLITDPLRDVHTGKENESEDMRDVMHRFRCIRDLCGCTVIFVHHSNKRTSDNASSRAGQRMRGSSAIHGGVDGGFYLSDLDTDKRTYWSNTVEVELKAAQGAGDFTLVLNVQDDENGEAVAAEWRVSRDLRPAQREKAEKILPEVLDWLAGRTEVCTIDEIQAVLGKRRQTIMHAVELGVRQKMIVREGGRGVRIEEALRAGRLAEAAAKKSRTDARAARLEK